MKSYLTVILGLCFPGLGHWYLDQKHKAVVFACCVTSCWLIGLMLDFDHYYWYEDIKHHKRSVFYTTEKVKSDKEESSFNPHWDRKVNFFNPKPSYQEGSITLKGHSRPSITLEVTNETTGERVQTQADYKGFFTFPPLSLALERNELIYGPANLFDTPFEKQVSVSSYDKTGTYVPGKLERIWHFIFKVAFPALSTPPLHFTGGWFQSKVISWWDNFPVVKDQKSIPAPLRDVGFYFIILACLLNLIILFDAYDNCHNKEYGYDIP